MCATATRRRPTSCASTASARILMNVLKTGNASTLDIIKDIYRTLPHASARSCPRRMTLVTLSDQSVFVRAAIAGVVREAAIAAALTGLLILLFLGSWRSTADHHHIDPPVDPRLDRLPGRARRDHQHHDAGRPRAGGGHPRRRCDRHDREHQLPPRTRQGSRARDPRRRASDRPARAGVDAVDLHRVRADVPARGHRQVPVHPAGRGGGVRHARLLPAVANPGAHAREVLAAEARAGSAPARAASFAPVSSGLRAPFRARARRLPRAFAPGHRRRPRTSLVLFLLAMAATVLLALPVGPLPGLGQDFFPSVDAGQLKLHVRASTGTRIEETAILCDAIERDDARDRYRPARSAHIVDNLGLPYSGINLAYSTSAPVGPGDADIFINLPQAPLAAAAVSASCARSCRRPTRRHSSPSCRRTWSARS